MPIDLSSGPNIAAGWPGPPQLSAPNIGELVRSILANKLARDKMTQESIADTIKNVQAQRQGDAYAEALRNAGLTQGQDISGLSPTQGTTLAKMIQEQTPDTEMDAYHKALASYYDRSLGAGRGGGGGAPRYPYTIPGTDETVDLPASDYARRRAEDVTTGSYQGILKSEADAKAKMQELEAKWGGLIKGKLRGEPAWPWQEDKTKEERIKDQILYNRAQQQYQMNQQQRENLEKRKPGIVGGAPAPVDTGTDTEDQTPLPQGGATPPPSVSQNDVNQVQQAPGITPSPIPSASPGTQTAQGYGVQGVRMRSPNGQVSYVDPAKVDYYKNLGAVVIP